MIRLLPLLASTLLATTLVVGCDDSPAAPGDPDSGQNPPTENDAGETSDAGTPDGGSPPDAGPGHTGSDCYYGQPGTSFTLPPPDANGKLIYENVQASFPNVDWQNIDRLYIQAGSYYQISLKGLPARPAHKKLVVTNKGGQVKVGPGYGCALSMLGGANWVLTGRPDTCSQTGDVQFPGHAGGNYAQSRGRYGFLVDPDFRSMLSTTDKITGLSGLCVSGGATDFELDFLEVQHSGYAGVVLKTDNTPTAIMRNVKVHDLYVHDCGAECLYAGNTSGNGDTQHVFENFEFYNNRMLRSGSAVIQFAQQGDGLHIHHNVFGVGGTRWRWEDWQPGIQDHGMQIHIRYGSAEVDHNIVLGGAHSYFTTFFGTNGSNGGPVQDPVIPNSTFKIHHNVFHSSLFEGMTLNGTKGSFNAAIRVEDNVLRGVLNEPEYYTMLGWSPNNQLIRIYAAAVPVFVGNNTYQNNKALGYHAGNQTNVTIGTNTPMANPPPVQFMNFMGLPDDFDYATIEWWQAHVQGLPSKPFIQYKAGDVVRYYWQLYRAKVDNENKQPDLNPTAWEELPLSVDDVRLRPGSPYQGMGLLE